VNAFDEHYTTSLYERSIEMQKQSEMQVNAPRRRSLKKKKESAESSHLSHVRNHPEAKIRKALTLLPLVLCGVWLDRFQPIAQKYWFRRLQRANLSGV